MTVSSINTGGTGGSQSLNQSSLLNGVNFDTFLTLLVAQLKYQDPMNPTDSTQFTGQLAQFSQVEQQINSNNYLAELLKQRDYGQQTLATSYLGKVVLAPGNAVAKQGSITEFGYSLDKAAAKVEVQVYDKNGSLVYTFAGNTQAGNHIVTWDGTNAEGVELPNGDYTVRVRAEDGDGKVLVSTPLVYGKVASVMNDGGRASLIMTDGRQVDIDDVLAVTSLSPGSGNTPPPVDTGGGTGTGDGTETGDAGGDDADGQA